MLHRGSAGLPTMTSCIETAATGEVHRYEVRATATAALPWPEIVATIVWGATPGVTVAAWHCEHRYARNPLDGIAFFLRLAGPKRTAERPAPPALLRGGEGNARPRPDAAAPLAQSTDSDKSNKCSCFMAVYSYLSGMGVLALFPRQARHVEPGVEKTATVVSSLLELQHYPPEKALLALTLAADKIEAGRDNIEALKMRAALRGAGAVNELIEAEGGQISAEEFAHRVNVSRETVNQWRQQDRVLGWKRGARNYSYPAWQIHQGGLLPGLESVLSALRPKKLGVLEIADYLLSVSDELGGRPLDLLRKADVEPVIEHAKRYGCIGA